MSSEHVSPVRHPLITQQRHLVTEYAFCLGEIPTTIRARFFHQQSNQRYSSEQSHYIQTPLQDEPSLENVDDHESLDDCLKAITDAMIAEYQRAEQAGHTPSEDWLLPSREFD